MSKNKQIKKEPFKNNPAPKKLVAAAILTKKDFIYAALIALAAFLLYANTLNHGYTLDDFSVIKDNNVTTQGTAGISKILKTSYRYGYLNVNDGLYRPLSLVMFAIEWEYFPDTPAAGHFMNVLLYALTGFLLYLLLRRWLRNQNFIVPLITALLFICHPIHTEIVASIKSRDEIVCFLLMISSFHLLLNYVDHQSKRSLFFSIALFFLALLSKETGLTMLAVVPLMLHFFRNITIKKNIVTSAIFLIPILTYLFLRKKVLGTTVGLDAVSFIDNSLYATSDVMSQIATAIKVLGMYLQLLVFPHPLICDRSYNHIPNITFSDAGSLISLLVYLAMGAYALVQFRKKNIFSFAIIFYLIGIALFSNIVFKIGSVMAERFVYFASFGFCLAFAVGLKRVLTPLSFGDEPVLSLSKEAGERSMLGITGIILLLYSFKTITRNENWKNNFTLYANDVNFAPNSTRMHYYLGRDLVKDVAGSEPDSAKRAALFDWGIRELKRSTEITPSYNEAYSQMGLGYMRKGERKKGIECYLEALKHEPNDPITLNNLGAEYFKDGRYAECIEMYNKVLTLNPTYADAMVNLGSCYGTIRDFDNAIKWFKRATEVNPNYVRAYQFLSYSYRNKGDITNADYYLKEAQRLDPSVK